MMTRVRLNKIDSNSMATTSSTTPFTDLLRQTKADLLLKTQDHLAAATGTSSTYLSYMLTSSWVPPNPIIKEMHESLSQYVDRQPEQHRGSLASLKLFLDAASQQLAAHPQHAKRPGQRQATAEVSLIDGAAVDRGAAEPVVANGYVTQKQAEGAIVSAFASAQQTRLLLVRGWAVIGTQRALLREALAKKDRESFKMQILMADPNSPSAQARAKEIGETRHAMVEGVTWAIREVS